MPQKIFNIVITSFVVLIVVGALFWVYLLISDRLPSKDGDGLLGGTFPFGVGEEITLGGGEEPVTGSGTTTLVSGGEDILKPPSAKTLTQLSQEAVSGISFTSGTSSVPRVRFVERATGHVVEVDLETKKDEKISNTTVPKIYESIFASGGKNVILRYLRGSGDIESFLLPLESRVNPGEPRGVFLPINTTEITQSPNQKRILYLTRSLGGGAITERDLDSGKEVRVFNSPLSELVMEWPEEGRVHLTTRASSRTVGFSYVLNRAAGNIEKIFGPVTGLSIKTSPDGKFTLAGGSMNGQMVFGLFDNQTREMSQFRDVTLPEKCVWLKNSSSALCGKPRDIPLGNSEYPDSWYQGLVSFSDDVYVISTTPKNFVPFISLNEAGKESVEIDITKPNISDSGDYLVFINKRNGTPWALDLTNWWPLLGD